MAVTVDFILFVEYQIDVIKSVRAILMTRQLKFLIGGKVRIGFFDLFGKILFQDLDGMVIATDLRTDDLFLDLADVLFKI